MNSDGNVGHNGDTIIIVRRKHDEDHGHHGGAWKIAYADFVTAMMAFFLVMWLINAANEKTKAQVASYFNPIKLTDTTTSTKGLNEPVTVTKPGDSKEKPGSPEEQKPSEGKTPSSKPEQQSHFTDDEMFRNPYGILAQLAGQAVVGAPPGHSEKGLAIIEIAAPGQSGGEAYRDPFDPLAWKSPPQPKEPPPVPKAAKSEPTPATKDVVKIDKKSDAKNAVVAENKPIANPDGAKKIVENNDATKQPAVPAVAKPAAPQIAKTAPPPTPLVAKLPTQPVTKVGDAQLGEAPKGTIISDPGAKMALAVREELLQKLKQYKPEESPAFEVKQTTEGVLISLTDSLSFDMFAVGSAEPKPQLVLLMEKVASTLRDYKGKIVIRGHTDSRRFRNRDYDNWRLSTARAQMAYYMLIRAGVDEGKVERIEGYADRDLKIPDKPESAGNRRIELLLKVDET